MYDVGTGMFAYQRGRSAHSEYPGYTWATGANRPRSSAGTVASPTGVIDSVVGTFAEWVAAYGRLAWTSGGKERLGTRAAAFAHQREGLHQRRAIIGGTFNSAPRALP